MGLKKKHRIMKIIGDYYYTWCGLWISKYGEPAKHAVFDWDKVDCQKCWRAKRSLEKKYGIRVGGAKREK